MNTQAHIHKIEIDSFGYGLIRYGDQRGYLHLFHKNPPHWWPRWYLDWKTRRLVRKLIRTHDKASLREARRLAREQKQDIRFSGRVEKVVAAMQPKFDDQWATRQ